MVQKRRSNRRALGARVQGLVAVMIGGAALTFVDGSAHAQQSSPDVVAVFDIQLQDVRGFKGAEIEKATAYLDSAVAQAGFRTVPRAEIQERIVEQQKESYRACYSEACQIELGKALAANKVARSTWARFGSSCDLTIWLYDLRTGVADFSTRAGGDCDESGLRSAIDQVGVALRARGQGGFGTFSLELNEARRIRNPETDRKGYLKIHAQAKGRASEKIEVYLNGELAGIVVNGLFTKELPVGRYRLHLRAVGDLFAPRTFDIEMTPKNVSIPDGPGTIELAPVFGTVVIAGTPPKATVLINGEPRSLNGPLREERRVGTYTIVVESPGFLPRPAEQVTIKPGEEKRISYELVRNAGSINVVGAPTGASISVDGSPVGSVPLKIPEAEIGEHVVEIRAPGHHLERKIVSVRRGETAHVEVRLQEKRARLKVEAMARVMGAETPVEADVFIDGTRVGTTPWKGEVRAEVAHGLQLRLGREGTPEREVELPEGLEQREVIDVPASWGGGVSTLRFDLVPGPWEIRSGSVVLKSSGPNPVRPGRVPLDLLLDGKKVGAANVVVSPEQSATITVTARPRTVDELTSSRTAWQVRRWVSLGAALAAAAVGGERMIAAHSAQSSRDQAYSALRSTDDPNAFDMYRGQVIDRERARDSAQTVGLAFLGGAAALGAWSAFEWLFGEPGRGHLEGDGIEEVAP